MNTSRHPSSAPRQARNRARDSGRSAELEPVFAAVASYFGLLSEPTRIKILHAICQSERSVGEIVAATGATQTNVSRHLALLHDAGVVSRRREGNTVHYQVADAMFADLCRTVCVQIAGRIDARQPLKKSLLGFAAQQGRT
jgi:DNA-binding transcriptional ArsR family regulator